MVLWAYIVLEQQEMRTTVSAMAESLQRRFYRNLQNTLDSLQMARAVFVADEGVVETFLLKDRQKLYTRCEPLFSRLKNDFSVTHLYFQLLDSTTFLRMHAPELYGDETYRKTFINAVAFRRTYGGLELGKTAFALRIVGPYYYGNELIGFVEFGTEIEQFIETVCADLPEVNQLALLVKKELIGKSDWDHHKKLTRETNTWSELESYVVMNEVHDDFMRRIHNVCTALKPAQINNQKILPRIDDGSKIFQPVIFPLIGAGNEMLGVVMAHIDITSLMEELYREVGVSIVFFSVMLVVFGLIGCTVLNRIVVCPVQRLTDTVKTIIDGDDMSARLNVKSDDEIGMLARSFNTLIDRQQSTTVSKKYVDNIVSSMLDLLIVTDSELRIKQVNKAACELLGYDEDELTGKSISEIYVDAGASNCDIGNVNRCGNAGENMGWETIFKTKSGTMLNMLITISLMKNSRGRVEGLLIVAKDITGIKTIESQLTKSKWFLQMMIDASPAPIFFKDHLGRYRICNTAFERVIGLPRDEIMGKTVHEIYPLEIVNLYHAKDIELLEYGGIQMHEAPVLFADGNVREISFHKAAVCDEDDDIIGLVGIMLDITERKRAEEELRASEQKYRTLVDNLNIGIYRNTGGDNPRFLHANKELASMFGYESVEQILQSCVSDFFKYPEDEKLLFAELTKQGFVKNKELRLKRRDGSLLWASCTAHSTRGHNGKILWIDGVVEEITKRKTIENELTKSYMELTEAHIQLEKANNEISKYAREMELLVKERTRQLVFAEKMSGLGVMASGIAHELNQPLTGIKLFSENVLWKVSGAKRLNKQSIVKSLNDINRFADRMAEIITHMREFSRGSDNRMKACDINKIILSSLILIKAQLKGSDIILEEDLAETLPPVLADSTRIEQVLINLIGNAKDALEDKENGVICVHTFSRELCVYIEITDNGCGISPQKIDSIFEPFFTTKEPGKGTGLGLFISYGIIQEHHGNLSVSSKENLFTTFTITLPHHNQTT